MLGVPKTTLRFADSLGGLSIVMLIDQYSDDFIIVNRYKTNLQWEKSRGNQDKASRSPSTRLPSFLRQQA